MNKNLLTAALAGLVAAGAQAHDMTAVPKDKEKCYGAAKAGKNDCGSADGKHGCAGQASVDNDPNEWRFTNKGECATLGGSTKKPEKKA